MWITEDKQTSAFFGSSVCFLLGNGETFLFWSNPWLMGSSLFELALEVVNAVPARWQNQWTVVASVVGMSWTADITRALTVQDLVQFINLYQRLQGMHLRPDDADRLEW
jgi:hypothetical protein